MRLEAHYINGEAGKPPLVFVHGMCGGAWSWDNLVGYFNPRGYPCLAFSMRGHGSSGGGGMFRIHTHTLGAYLRDLESVIAEYDVRRPVLVGHSMGGAIVQKYMELHPDEVAGAVLLSSIPRGTRDIRRGCKRRTALKILISSNLALTLFAVFGIRLKRGLARSKPCSLRHEEHTAKFVENFGHESLIAALQTAFTRIYTQTEFGGTCPVMVAGGGADYLFGRGDFERTAAYYGTEPLIFPEMCHEMQLDPDWPQLAEAIENFLEINVTEATYEIQA